MLGPEGMADYLAALAADYPIASIEDGLAEDDWEGWRELTARIGTGVQVLGDDLFTTNPVRLPRGIREGEADGQVRRSARHLNDAIDLAAGFDDGARGAGGRLRDKQIPVIFHQSLYATRLPIGETNDIATVTRADFLDYYTKWYRPDMMAVVAVGDFDAKEIEKIEIDKEQVDDLLQEIQPQAAFAHAIRGAHLGLDGNATVRKRSGLAIIGRQA